jgi:hypothetical protein
MRQTARVPQSGGMKIVNYATYIDWPPISSTLIAGEDSAILVDTPITTAQASTLADWVAAKGKNLTGIYITHGHPDHWFGASVLLDHFPAARMVATPAVVRQMRRYMTPDALPLWRQRFPGQMPSRLVVAGHDRVAAPGSRRRRPQEARPCRRTGQHRRDARVHPRLRAGAGGRRHRPRRLPEHDRPVPGPCLPRRPVGIRQQTQGRLVGHGCEHASAHPPGVGATHRCHRAVRAHGGAANWGVRFSFKAAAGLSAEDVQTLRSVET